MVRTLIGLVCFTKYTADLRHTAYLPRQQWPCRQILYPEGSAKGGAGRALRNNHSAHVSPNLLLSLIIRVVAWW